MMIATIAIFTSITRLRNIGGQLQNNVGLLEEDVKTLLLQNYTSGGRQRWQSNGPTIVNVSVYLHSISSINEALQEYTVDLLLRQYWHDDRLSFGHLKTGKLNSIHWYQDEANDKIWRPDTYFPKMRNGHAFDITVPNRILINYASGDMLLSARYSMTFPCNMDFSLFPFDTQLCDVLMESYVSTTEEVLLRWHNSFPLILKGSFRFPKFRLMNKTMIDCPTRIYPTGSFSCIKFRLVLSRQLHFYLVEAFLPTTLHVIASWVGFWIDPASAPARVGMACVLMLSNVALGTSIKSNLPPVSYVKAIDVWLGICTSFVFFTLVEYGLANYAMVHPRFLLRCSEKVSSQCINCLQRPKPSGENTSQRHPAKPVQPASLLKSNPPAQLPTDDCFEGSAQHRNMASMSPAENHERVDCWARIVFPLAFTVTTVCYALVMLCLSQNNTSSEEDVAPNFI